MKNKYCIKSRLFYSRVARIKLLRRLVSDVKGWSQKLFFGKAGRISFILCCFLRNKWWWWLLALVKNKCMPIFLYGLELYIFIHQKHWMLLFAQVRREILFLCNYSFSDEVI